MARMQIVPLPSIATDGGDWRTPFIIVFDGLDPEDDEALFDEAHLRYVKEQTGASLVVSTESTLDAPCELLLTDQQNAELLRAAGIQMDDIPAALRAARELSPTRSPKVTLTLNTEQIVQAMRLAAGNPDGTA